MEHQLALASDIVGSVQNTVLPSVYQPITGITLFLTNILRLVFVGAGIYAFINLLVSGFQYMTAGGDSKALEAAWARIWQSLLGLVLIVGSFALAALFGYIIFGEPGFILDPKIYGPTP